MKRCIIGLIILSVCVAFLGICVVRAQGQEVQGTKPPEVSAEKVQDLQKAAEQASAKAEEMEAAAEIPEMPEMSKEDILENLNRTFTYNPDIMQMIQGMSATEDEAGNMSFQYNGTPLEDLDQDTLFGLMRTANQHMSLRNYERLQRQLNQLKQVEQLNRQQRQMKQLQQQRR